MNSSGVNINQQGKNRNSKDMHLKQPKNFKQEVATTEMDPNTRGGLRKKSPTKTPTCTPKQHRPPPITESPPPPLPPHHTTPPIGLE